MESRKIVFTGLGPEREYNINEKNYKDGDVVEVEQSVYNVVVEQKHFAQDWTKELEERTLKSLAYAEKKRAEVLKKMQKLQQKGGNV